MPAFRAGRSLLLSAALLTTFAASTRPATHHTIEEGKVQVIESQVQLPSPVRAGGPVIELGPVLFGGNVLQQQAKEQPDHWVVAFCPSWWEGCQALMQQYQDEAADWQARLNDGLLSLRGRFGFVDCAAHKTLCNEQWIEEYPTIVHYHRGARVGQWSMTGKGDAGRLTAWLEAELGHVPSATSPEKAVVAEPASWRALLAPGLGRDLTLIAVVLVANCWAFLSSGDGPRKEKAAALPSDPAGDKAEAAATSRTSRLLPRDWVAARGVSLEL